MVTRMQPYKNLDHDSGISAFEIGPDFIVVQFRYGGSYLYDYESAGASNIEQMKELALRGSGLATFINRNVRDRYAKKLS